MFERVERRHVLAFAVYIAMLLPTLWLGLIFERPVVLLAALTLPVMLAWRDRPVVFAGAMVVGGLIARIAILGTGGTTDQIETTQAAAQLVFGGGNPYGHGFPGTSTGHPFPYGPLALLAYLPGIWTEIAAGAVTMVVLYRCRALVTLALYAACPLIVRGTIMGMNDVLPGLLILVALLSVRRSPVGAAIVLGAGVAIKPYVVAWLPSLVGLGGLEAAVAFGAASLVAWIPLLAWGPAAYLRSLELASNLAPVQVNGVAQPALRLLAVPLGLLAFVAGSWRASALIGGAIFALLMGTGNWFSYGYLLAPLPLLGVALESRDLVPVLGRARPSRTRWAMLGFGSRRTVGSPDGAMTAR